MIELINHFGRIQKMSRVIALLQPSPETVSLFDEVIVIAEGELLFAGPIDSVGDYFSKLGYKPPGHMVRSVLSGNSIYRYAINICRR